jgi:hypothetical protein
MRFGKPSPALVVAIIALIAALAGTALAATGQIVNIADGTTVSNLAKVDSTGKLNVGDGSGSMTVDGAVREANLGTFTRFTVFPATNTCAKLAAPPAGKALVVKTIHADMYQVDAPGANRYIAFYVGANPCVGGHVLTLHPDGVGLDTVPFEPGLIVPGGQELNVVVTAGVSAELFGTGYTVSASGVPGS